MKLKVCGMKRPENMEALLENPPDYMGLIFYKKSARHVEGVLNPGEIPSLGKTQLIGVFVDETEAYILRMAKAYGLKGVQLHGKESPELCRSLQQYGLFVIKAFSIGNEAFDFAQLAPYQEAVDYFLFDTKGENPGGNGVSFRWDILEKYTDQIPFFLSGGISPQHIERIKAFQHPMLYALDINSKFEIEPGIKDVVQVHKFGQEMNRLR